MKKGRILAGVLAAAMVLGSMAGCGSDGSKKGAEATGEDLTQGDLDSTDEANNQDEVIIDIYQFKVETVSALEKTIALYEERNPHVTINLETLGGGGDYKETLKVKMQSNKKPDIFNMDGPQDVQDYEAILEDLSDQPWVDNAVTGALDVVSKEGKVYGLPYSLEGYGFIYNKRIFEKAGIDADSLITYNALEQAVRDLDKRIKAGEFQEDFPLLEAAFEYPAKETWVIGDHTANLPMIPELKDPISALETKEIEMSYSSVFQKLIDLQTLYSPSGDDRSKLCAVDYATQVGGGLAIERVAMIQQGNWISPEVVSVDPELLDDLGMLPIPVEGYKEDCITSGVPSYWSINKESDDKVKEEAKRFLDWMYQSDEGKDLIVNDFLFIPPFINYEGIEPQDALSKEVKKYTDAGRTMPWVLRGFPTGWSLNVGGSVQKYLSGDITWDQVTEEAKEAWKDARQ